MLQELERYVDFKLSRIFFAKHPINLLWQSILYGFLKHLREIYLFIASLVTSLMIVTLMMFVSFNTNISFGFNYILNRWMPIIGVLIGNFLNLKMLLFFSDKANERNTILNFTKMYFLISIGGGLIGRIYIWYNYNV